MSSISLCTQLCGSSIFHNCTTVSPLWTTLFETVSSLSDIFCELVVTAGLVSGPNAYSTNKYIRHLRSLIFQMLELSPKTCLEAVLVDSIAAAKPISFTVAASLLAFTRKRNLIAATILDDFRLYALTYLKKRIQSLKAASLSLPTTSSPLYAPLAVLTQADWSSGGEDSIESSIVKMTKKAPESSSLFVSWLVTALADKSLFPSTRFIKPMNLFSYF